MSEAMRAAMTGAAVKAAQAIKYSGAGTIEFIVDASSGLRPDRFWFMEMNTRLQVEHPVTEMVTGLDLVEWQLRVAAGEKLPKRQEEIALDGHAFEARIYAEDPARGFLPATGTLHHLAFPQGPATRVETGVRAGDAISPYYDPMIAKLVVHAATRPQALAGLVDALERTEIAGSTTNLAFLAALSRDADFADGDVDTGLIARKQGVLATVPAPSPVAIARAAVAAAGGEAVRTADPWSSLAGYAHFHPIEKRIELVLGETTIAAALSAGGDGRFNVKIGGERIVAALDTARLARWPGHVTVFEGALGHSFRVPDPFELDADAAGGGDSLRAPMPGLVKIVRVAAGEAVVKGQPLLVLEAMKMEHTIAAPHDGVLAEIASEGAQVTDGTVLVRFAETAA
jgi:3-methylcrotonyl-CoA carboxylase alpha subunit